MENATAGIGHNRGPITPPTDEDFLADLEARYPNIATTFAELAAKFSEAPKVIKDDDTAGKVQDLYRTMREWMDEWDEARKKEKKPWDRLAKAVQNFFTKKTDTLETMSKDLRARHTAYAEEKAEAARKEAAAEAERQRVAAEEAAAKARKAEEERVAAERAAEEARQKQEAALKAEAEAKARREEEERRAEVARAEQRRLEEERKAREKAEKEAATNDLREAKKLAREAKSLLDDLTELPEDTAPQPRLVELADLSGPLVPVLNRLRVRLAVLTDEQKVELADITVTTRDIAAELQARKSAKDRRAHEKAEAEARERADKAAAEAEALRKAEEELLAKARREREEAEAAAAAAKEEARKHRLEAGAAQKAETAAERQGKAAAREGAEADKAAGKAERRADRLEGRLDNASDADFSRTRGDFSVGSLTGAWKPRVEDWDKLSPTLGPLGPYILGTAVEAAITKWMRERQGSWAAHRKDEVYRDPALPGVLFEFVPDSAIR